MRLSKLNIVYRQENHDYLITLLDNNNFAFFNETSRTVFEPFDVTDLDIMLLKGVMADLNYIANKINKYKTVPCSSYMFGVAKDDHGRNIFPILDSSALVDSALYSETNGFTADAIELIDCKHLNTAWNAKMTNTNVRPLVSAKTLPFEWLHTGHKVSFANAEILLESVKLSDPNYLNEIVEDVESGITSNNDGFAIFIDGLCQYSTLKEYQIEKGHPAQLSIVIKEDDRHDVIYTLPILNGSYRYCSSVFEAFSPLRFQPASVNTKANFDQDAVESMINSLNRLSNDFYRHNFDIDRTAMVFALDDQHSPIFSFNKNDEESKKLMIEMLAENHSDLYEAWVESSSVNALQSKSIRTRFANAPIIKHEQCENFYMELPLLSKENINASVLDTIMEQCQQQISSKVAIFLDGDCVASNYAAYSVQGAQRTKINVNDLLNLGAVFGTNFLN